MDATYVKRITRKIPKVTTFALIVELITLIFFSSYQYKYNFHTGTILSFCNTKMGIWKQKTGSF